MDDIDRAQKLEQAERDHMIRQTTRVTDQADRAGSETCIDCDVVIPSARRKSVPHAMRCVGCQELSERRN